MSGFLKNTLFPSVVLALAVLGCFATDFVFGAEDEESGSETVTYADGLVSVAAKQMRPEDLMKEIGEKCGIKIVVVGEVFSEVPLSIQFQNMPVRKAIERVLRRAGISNYLIHFGKGDNGNKVVELDLIGKKGGEKYLTQGAALKPPTKKKEKKSSASRRKRKMPIKENLDMFEAEKIQENFLSIMDEVLNAQLEDGEEPDPAEILRLFKEVVPPEMKEQIPPEVLEELEKLE